MSKSVLLKLCTYQEVGDLNLRVVVRRDFNVPLLVSILTVTPGVAGAERMFWVHSKLDSCHQQSMLSLSKTFLLSH